MPRLPGSLGALDRKGARTSGLLALTLQALLPSPSLPGNYSAHLLAGPPGHSLGLPPGSFLHAPSAPRVFQPARHELPLVLGPSRVLPLHLRAHTPPGAPRTGASPRPFSLLGAWLLGRQDPWGLSPASSWVWYSSLLALPLGLRSSAACGTHTRVHTPHTWAHTQVHTQFTQHSNCQAFEQSPGLLEPETTVFT